MPALLSCAALAGDAPMVEGAVFGPGLASGSMGAAAAGAGVIGSRGFDGAFATAVRWLVKHYLNELKPNGGSSVKDSVARLERQVEEIYRILLSNSK